MNPRLGLRYLSWAAAAVVALDVVLTGLPGDPAARVAVPVVAVLGLTLWLVATRSRLTRALPLTLCFVGAGLCGAVLDLVRSEGTGYTLGFMAAAGLGLRVPRRHALIAGGFVIVATGLAEAAISQQPVGAFLNLAIGGGFLFLASALAGASRRAADSASARRAADAEAARLAERGHIARELHDVLAHTLAGLTVQLEGARLLATRTGADPRLVAQLTDASALARDGVAGARTVVEALRDGPPPGPARIPDLVAKAAGIHATLTVSGEPRPLSPERGLALYRTVQEALTNTAKHAGPGAQARVALTWTADTVTAEITDSGGSTPAGLPSGGHGLTGLAERAALAGGKLDAGPSGDGWLVRLSLPLALETA
ncbi:sensor histidine kinase [Actinoplanes sp. RD1]|uniref:sensor histidine kinase n=1 Tax=Actinoplanes sp. RD1 TaxID=3064538 RepID=UPI00274218AF|nr:histidine kinase [Actinoplanes sp. RD1]